MKRDLMPFKYVAGAKVPNIQIEFENHNRKIRNEDQHADFQPGYRDRSINDKRLPKWETLGCLTERDII